MGDWENKVATFILIGGLAVVGWLALESMEKHAEQLASQEFTDEQIDSLMTIPSVRDHEKEWERLRDSVRRAERQSYWAMMLQNAPVMEHDVHDVERNANAAVRRWAWHSHHPAPYDSLLLRYRYEDSVAAAGAMEYFKFRAEGMRADVIDSMNRERRSREACGVIRGEYVCFTIW